MCQLLKLVLPKQALQAHLSVRVHRVAQVLKVHQVVHLLQVLRVLQVLQVLQVLRVQAAVHRVLKALRVLHLQVLRVRQVAHRVHLAQVLQARRVVQVLRVHQARKYHRVVRVKAHRVQAVVLLAQAQAAVLQALKRLQVLLPRNRRLRVPRLVFPAQ